MDEILKKAAQQFPNKTIGEIDKYGSKYLVTILVNGSRVDPNNEIYIYDNGKFEPFNPSSDFEGFTKAMNNKVYP